MFTARIWRHSDFHPGVGEVVFSVTFENQNFFYSVNKEMKYTEILQLLLHEYRAGEIDFSILDS